MLTASWEEGAGPCRTAGGCHPLRGEGGGYRAIQRNLLIPEPRLPFNPTGRRCLNGRSARNGGKETSWPGREDLELGTLPSGRAPFPLRSRPAPRVYPRHRLLDCLYSLSWSPENSPFFPHLGIRGRVFLWKSTTRRRGCSRKLRTETPPSLLGDRGPLLPSFPLTLRSAHLRAHSQPGLLPKPTPVSVAQVHPRCPQSIHWEKLRHVGTRG